MGKKLVPEHYEYFCDFFCNPDPDGKYRMASGKLYGIKLTEGGTHAIYVSQLNDKAQLHICAKCLGNMAALHHQISKQEKIYTGDGIPELTEVQ